MFAWLDIFPYAYGTGTTEYGIDEDLVDTGNASEGWEGISDISYGDVFTILFFDVNADNWASVILSVVLLGGAILFAVLVHSPAPLVVGFLGNIMKNVYVNNMAVFNQFPINNYLMFACALGMIILFIVTCAEYLTHGDA